MENSRSRPFGVTLVAILFLAIAIICLIIAARYILNPAGDEEMILLFTRLKIPVTYLNLLAVPPLVTAGLATLMFRGLWEERPWGRVATVFLSFMGMLLALAAIAFVQVFNFGGSQAIWIAAGAFALSTIIFIYFLKIPWPAATEPIPEAAPEPEPVVARPAVPGEEPPPAPASAPEPAPVLSPPDDMYDTIHSAPTLITGAAVLKGDETLQIGAAPVPETRPTACLVAVSGRDQGRHFEISSDDVLIGRHPTLATFVMDDPTISAQHARIRYEDGHYLLVDLDSTNGTFVNRQRVKTQVLADQDRIRFGAVELIFSTPCQD
jgi:hypothetical protein